MSVAYLFVCDACGETGTGVPGDYLHPDPPLGWTWQFGSGLQTHACSKKCWDALEAVHFARTGKWMLPDSHERRAQHEAEARARPPPAPTPPPEPKRTRNSDWHVYFIQQGEDGAVKIGQSKNVAARLAQLQTSTPSPLRVLGTISGGAEKEKRLHAKFAAHRISGEWFRPDSELLSYIREHARSPE